MSTEMPDSPQQQQIVVCPLAGRNIPFQSQIADTPEEEKEIDILGMARKALKYRKVFIISILTFTALGVAYSALLPIQYKAVVSLDATKHLNVKSVDSSVMAQRLGGIMSLAGVGGGVGGFDSSSNEPQYNKAVMGTRRFRLWMVKKYNLRDSVKYLAPKEYPGGLSENDVASIVGDSFELEINKGHFVSLQVKTYSPLFSIKLANIIADAINSYSAQMAIDRAKNDIAIFNKELESTTFLETREMLYGLIAERTKTIMLAKAQPEYAFQIIDSPVASTPESKKKIVIGLSVLIGSLVGGTIAIFLDLFQKPKQARF